jgi:iron(II)-dependent oxidoreductase
MAFKAFWRRESQQPDHRSDFVLDDDPLKAHIQLGRYGTVAGNPGRWRGHESFESLYRTAVERIDEAFALVPEGFVSIARSVLDAPGGEEIDVETEPFLLQRRCVTNAEFRNFVVAGGYDDLSIWREEIWPHLISFHDQTEQPGPRFWRGGTYAAGTGDHPVVGIAYYEAEAYARWAGYRLPMESEWQMAASWRIRSSALMFRRYPWGESIDTHRCNVWASGVGTTVPVGAHENGATPNGILQLIGNVWEWTCSEFEAVDASGHPLVGDMLMHTIRGGAFDTYFSSQATSDFRTGQGCLIRSHNTGFRCALDVEGAARSTTEPGGSFLD